MRLQAYRDESRPRHFDLIFGGEHRRSIDPSVGNNFRHVGGGSRLRPDGPLRIEDCQFEPVDPLKTHCATA
jgi:hypothetical protein